MPKNTTNRPYLRLVTSKQPVKKPGRPLIQKCGRYFEELLALGKQLREGGAK
jgi:hypothetical protein